MEIVFLTAITGVKLFIAAADHIVDESLKSKRRPFERLFCNIELCRRRKNTLILLIPCYMRL